jgi:hypothetical protein
VLEVEQRGLDRMDVRRLRILVDLDAGKRTQVLESVAQAAKPPNCPREMLGSDARFMRYSCSSMYVVDVGEAGQLAVGVGEPRATHLKPAVRKSAVGGRSLAGNRAHGHMIRSCACQPRVVHVEDQHVLRPAMPGDVELDGSVLVE